MTRRGQIGLWLACGALTLVIAVAGSLCTGWDPYTLWSLLWGVSWLVFVLHTARRTVDD
jgi:hypothetical protein